MKGYFASYIFLDCRIRKGIAQVLQMANETMLSLGIDIGSTTAKVVLMDGDQILYEKYERHFSQVRQKTLELLEEMRPQLTGKTFTAVRWSVSNHMDTEPASRADTAVLKEIYGGSWSWRRRPILVKYNGHVYAASMNGMPHGTSTIDNGLDGHFCIHFTGSKTHGTDRVDEDHQNAVAAALKYEW